MPTVTAKIVDDSGREFGQAVFSGPDAMRLLNAAETALLAASACQLRYVVDEELIGECELCGQLYWLADGRVGGRSGKARYCSDDCWQEEEDLWRSAEKGNLWGDIWDSSY